VAILYRRARPGLPIACGATFPVLAQLSHDSFAFLIAIVAPTRIKSPIASLLLKKL